jgi:dihydropyrimidine dehydrogenase (NAD+) subunit PreA
MADLTCTIAGITSPNPFWLASAPPTDKEYNVVRAFEAGWGGVVWKTLGEEGPPVVNVSSRYGSISYNGGNMAGLNNIELITDRPLEVNLEEITRVKKNWPDRVIIVSLMVPCEEQAWKDILARADETGCDGYELNFGCPHGMSERGMGAAVGQVPEYINMVTKWCKKYTKKPVFVKLTPNITNILIPARGAVDGGADAVSLINTINSIAGVDLDVMAPTPVVDGVGAHGGYCGPAVKPIALCMVGEIARDPECNNIPISAIGGISNWHDAAEFISLGAGSLQVCTAAMHHGFKIVEDMIDGLSNWMDDKGYETLEDFRGMAVPNYKNWGDLNMNFETKAVIDQDACIQCGKCFAACEDTSHQSILAENIDGLRKYSVITDECVGCNLCEIVCPVDNCITMVPTIDDKPYMTWGEDPRNPANQSKKEA